MGREIVCPRRKYPGTMSYTRLQTAAARHSSSVWDYFYHSNGLRDIEGIREYVSGRMTQHKIIQHQKHHFDAAVGPAITDQRERGMVSTGQLDD